MCSVETCISDRIYRDGLCRGHHNRLVTFGDVFAHIPIGAMPRKRRPKVQRVCEMDGCNRPHHGKGLCKRHYGLQRNHGYVPTLIRGGNRPTDGECLTCVDAEWLLADNTDPDEIAKRMGYAKGREGLRRHLRAHDREDLAERMNQVRWGVSA